MSIEAMKLAAEFNRYFTSANGVDVPARVSVSRDEWRQLFAALSQQPATPEPVGFTYQAEIAYADSTGGNGSFWRVPPDLDDEAVPLYDHPAPSVPDDDFDLICSAIDKADTITMEGDYMLDSDDCIAVVRVMRVLLSVRAAMLAAK